MSKRVKDKKITCEKGHSLFRVKTNERDYKRGTDIIPVVIAECVECNEETVFELKEKYSPKFSENDIVDFLIMIGIVLSIEELEPTTIKRAKNLVQIVVRTSGIDINKIDEDLRNILL